MIQRTERAGPDDRVVDYSDPAQLPHPKRPRVPRKDTGEFVAAGVAAGMLIVGGIIYAGYLTNNPTPPPAPEKTVASTAVPGK